MAIPIYVSILRLLVPISILKWPLLGALASISVDIYDWVLVNLATKEDYILYQNWDKAMDLYYWIFALIIARGFKDIVAKRFVFGFFAYRIFGMVMFWLTQKREFLFLFPNFFENLFIFYLLFILLFKKQFLFTSTKITFIVLSIIIIPKIIHEYFMHFLEKQPWEIYDFGGYLGLVGTVKDYANYLSFGSILYLIPFLIGLYIANKLQGNKN